MTKDYRYLTKNELKSAGFFFHSKDSSMKITCDVWFSMNQLIPRMVPEDKYGLRLTVEEHTHQNGDYSDCVKDNI